MNGSDIGVLISIVVYLIGMIAIGLLFSKKNKNSDDFYLGGRKLGPLVTAMSAEASDMSSYLLMGVPGLAIIGRFAEASWTVIGLAVGTYLNWLIVAKRLRRYSARVGAVTLPDFFAKRYGDKRHILSLIAALVIIIFFVPYTASGFSACGKLFNSLFGVDYTVAMVLSAVVIVLYTTLGGFLAASTTDLIQSIVMTFALVIVLCYGINVAGGWQQVTANVNALPGFVDIAAVFNAETGKSEPYGVITVISTLAWGLGYFGMPHILLRFMAIENPKKLATSRRIATVWVVISMAVAVVIGLVGFAMVQTGAMADFEDGERVVIEISKLISSHGFAPALIAGLILAGILAATMSTADSQLLAASSSASQDIALDFFGVNLSDKKRMIIARLSVIVIAVIAVFLSLNPNSSIFRVVSFAWAGFGGAFGPVVLFALFWKRSNLWGALAGMLTGGITIFVWKFVIRSVFAGTVLDIYELLPAFLLASCAIVIVSLLTKAPEDEVVTVFEEIKSSPES